MNYNKFFEKANEVGLEALELSITKSKKFSFGLFKNEIDSYSISDSYRLSARGIYNGKLGYATSEKIDASTVDYIINHIKENATFNTSEDKPFIFPGSKKYNRKNVFSKKLANMSANEKINIVKKLDLAVKQKDQRINEVETQYQEETEEYILLNSFGLKLSSKQNYAVIYSSAVATDEQGETKNGFKVKILTDLEDLDIDEFASKVVKDTIAQFGSAPCKSGKYKCVFNPSSTSALLSFFLQNLSSEEVQKNTSLLKGKLNQQVCSKKLTINESPLEKNVFFRYFDDEGVATYNKTLIKNGVLQTYLYNLTTANKDGVETTGNGYKNGFGIGIRAVNVSIKPGKDSEEELFSKVKEGIYITDISGLHAGMNAQSGNFSLISQGFMIREGKLKEPVSLITVAGNLFDVFNGVVAVGSNKELQTNSYSVPSIYVKGIQVSGK
ncbi:MAG: TldD/PmbA family protein [Bacilli bacterium]|nr:TldD/PmbA family protein [Bacillales bacterium]MDY2575418.1 TldD/PmbA family protein [Bacilli bacterium]